MLSNTSKTNPAADTVKTPIGNRVQTYFAVENGRNKFFSAFTDGSELIEEYDSRSDDLIVRKWRRKSILGAPLPWEYEVGESEEKPSQIIMMESGIKESCNTPKIIRRDTTTHFTWTIKNLPYPKNVYCLQVEKFWIVVRTSNKKYFTKLKISDLERHGIELDNSFVSFDWANNTLSVWYRKPQKILENDLVYKRERARMQAEGDNGKSGDAPDCKQQ
ncbi:hypothetical protein HK098_001251 [Nowakowskiella sp. JEL0407]|nr:hypothetical protein HK098_001251 [Nowakowskiella sp. JEL0407]